jgi:hypothetical protein
MKRGLVLPSIGVAAVAALVFVAVAVAGNPHFVGSPTVTRTDNSLTVAGKVAGLGNEPFILVVVSADAACVNPGTKKPKAANKQSFSASDTFPVQNGKADFSVTLTATFQPSCTPPMTAEFSNVSVEVFLCTTQDVSSCSTTPTLSRSFPGTF